MTVRFGIVETWTSSSSSSSRQSVIKYRLSSAANRAHAGELIGRATVLSVSFSFSPIFSHPSSPFFNLPLFLLLLLLCISASEIFFSQFFLQQQATRKTSSSLSPLFPSRRLLSSLSHSLSPRVFSLFYYLIFSSPGLLSSSFGDRQTGERLELEPSD